MLCRTFTKRSSLHFPLFVLALYLAWFVNQRYKLIVLPPRYVPCSVRPLAPREDAFLAFDNAVSREDGEFLIPPIIHVVRLGLDNEEISLSQVDSIRIALSSVRDSSVLVHVDSDAVLDGEAWERLVAAVPASQLQVVRHVRPRTVFGLPFRSSEHLREVSSLRILMQYGGVALLHDTILQDDLTAYRRYECAASVATTDPTIADGRVIMANKEARILRTWLHGYHWADTPNVFRMDEHLCRAVKLKQ